MRKDTQLLRRSFTYNGKRYEVYGKNNSELVRKQTEKIEKLKRGEVLIDSAMTVSQWAEKCIDTYKTNLGDYSLKIYKQRMNACILKDIGQLKLKDVKPLTCQTCLNKQEGKSKFQINATYQMLNFIFQKAVDNELLNRNPAKHITKPQGTYHPRRALTVYEEEIFLSAVQDHPHKLMFLLMYGCGCRPSEAYAVEGRDFQQIDGRLYLHIRGKKTKSADRYVPVPDCVLEALPDKLDPFKLVCTTKNGTPIGMQGQKRAWKSLERLMNIAMGCKVYRNELIPPYPLATDLCSYCLRHTFCTNLQKRGIDIRTAQYLMGHSTIEMTANIYTHTQLDHIDEIYEDIITKPQKREVKKETARTNLRLVACN